MPQGSLTAIRWRPFRLPMRHRFQAAHGTLHDRAGIVVELRAADGVSGIAEASPLPALGGGTDRDVAVLLERHASAILAAAPGTPDALERSGSGAAALRCALDVASLDIEGRRAGLPVARLLNAAAVSDVAVNAVIGSEPGSPVALVAHAQAATQAGYRVLKLKVGAAASLDDDVMSVAAVRAALPDATIRLDANGAWSERRATEAIARFADVAVELLEQPVAASDVAALARLRGATSMRLAADEALATEGGAAAVIESRAADLLVLKPMLLGGLRPALALARRAAGAGIGAFVTTTFDSSVGTAAALQLAAALHGDVAHGLSTGEHLAADVVAEPLIPLAGRLSLPSAAGLGVELDARALDSVATGPWVEVRR